MTGAGGSSLDDKTALEAIQRRAGCNRDDDPEDWGVACCSLCICADEATGRKSLEDECREAGLK